MTHSKLSDLSAKIFLPAFLSFLISTCVSFYAQKTIAQTTVQGSFVYEGLTRNYRIYIPILYNPSVPVPLVLNLHGYTSNNIQQESYGDFRLIADTANFIIVHPNGTMDGTGNLFWNCFGASTVDDVGFLSALIDTISSAYNIDKNSVYSTGMSNGGIMSYHLACSLNGRIAAIASVTGTMSPAQKNSCTPIHPTPVMEIHGTADGTVPYAGSSIFVPIDSLVKFWAEYNNCSPTPAITNLPDINTSDGCTAQHHIYSGGDIGSSVELFKIIGGGHTWPGAPISVGVTNKDFSASAEIWRFFRKYKLDELSDYHSIYDSKPVPRVFPNPTNGKFFFMAEDGEGQTREWEIRIFNLTGVQIFQKKVLSLNSFIFDISEQPNGFYFFFISQNSNVRKGKIIKN